MDIQTAASLSVEKLLETLHSSLTGLTQGDVVFLTKKYGENILKNTAINPLHILIKQFASSLIYLLIIATGLSFFLQAYSDGFVILAILLVNALLGFFQEYKSEKAIQKLSKLINRQILVKRDGKTVLLEEKFLVPGDVVVIKEGDIIPADVRLLSVDSLSVDESQLSGESEPVIKKILKEVEKTEKASLGMAFAGSVVTKGEATAVVYATGYVTQLGKIASLSQSTKKETQYEKSLKLFSNFLMRITLFTLVVVFAAKLIISQDFSHISDLFIFVVALAITVVPEALPVIATVTLARVALQLAKRHVLVKRLSSIEDLGNITLLCTDKTGTLTENNMTITAVVANDKVLFEKLAIATLSQLDEKRMKIHDPYDKAFLSFISPEVKEQAKEYTQLEDLAFDPEARRRRVVVEDKNKKKYYLVVIGSAETILHISSSLGKENYFKDMQADGKQGIRNLALAYKEIPYKENFNVLENENGLHFLGYAKLVDPLRPTSKHTIELAEKMGVGIKVLTGDSKEVAEYVGREIGLLKETDKVYIGDELEKMTPEEFKKAITNCPIFAKVTPLQKYNIIKVLKEDFVVGYQGDGINDAPSLKLADVGIAVDTATDVAKDSAEILLLRKDLEVIINGIRYGRTIFVNINKYIKYTMVGSFGNFFALAGLFLISDQLPLLPVQLLLTSLLSDLPLIFVYSDSVNPIQIRRPQVFNIHSLMFVSLILGTFTTLFEFIFYTTVKAHASGFVQTSLFLFLTFQLVIIFSIRDTDYFWKGRRPSLLLSSAIIITAIISIAITYIPFFTKLFSFTALPLQELALIILVTEAYFISLDIVKVWYYKIVGSSLPKN